MNKNLVVIPAYNEEETIREVVTKALRHADVSVTDDGSRDKTPQILRSIQEEYLCKGHCNRLNIITHPESTHIPKAIQDGLNFATQKYDKVVTMDAGLSHDPEVLSEFFNFDPNIDIVIGSRIKTANIPCYRKTISSLATRVVNYSLAPSYLDLKGPDIKDCTSGYRRYSKRAVELIAKANLISKAFDFHMEAVALCYRAGMSVAEIPIQYVFSNSSFNTKVLKQAIYFGMFLLFTKRQTSSPKSSAFNN